VVYRIAYDPNFKLLDSPDDQNILLWAGLLHDIEKQGNPLFEGRDYIHPFNSACRVLSIFQHYGLLQGTDESL
jgi:hypothetical protein